MRPFDELTDREKAERIARLAEKALRAYGLEGDLSLVSERRNTVFRLRCAGASYAVRLSPPGSESAPVERELHWLASLAREARLAVPEPILSRSGELLRRVSMEGISGTRTAVVFSWVGGERREADLTEDDVADAGRFAARLHRHAETFRWPEELALDPVDLCSRLSAARSLLDPVLASDAREQLQRAAAFIEDALCEMTAATREAGIVHGALRLRRLRYGAEGVGAVGFGACRVASAAEDLSPLWADLAGRDATPALRRAFLAGYRQERMGSAPAESVISAFAALRALEEAAASLPSERAKRSSAAQCAADLLRRGLAAAA